MDGDKIAILTAGYLKKLLTAARLHEIKLGLVQTAYANGASTQYITQSLVHYYPAHSVIFLMRSTLFMQYCLQTCVSHP